MKLVFATFLVFSLVATVTQAQVAVTTNNTQAHPSAALDVNFTGKGLLTPRMTHSGMDAIVNPAEGLMVYCTDCGSGGLGCLAVFFNGGWHCINDGCIVPPAPFQGSHIIAGTSVTWVWQAVSGATGYRWSSGSNYASATDVGNVTSRAETGLQCNTAFTRYVWAYNACGRSDSVILTATTLSCDWSCGQSITDSRDGKTYQTVLIGSQCWLKQNLNAGTRTDGNNAQSDNSTIEKYCYNDIETNCNTYGGLYQWAEMVQYLNGTTNTTYWSPWPTGPVQGICPQGWHIPAYSEFHTLMIYLGVDCGGKMKETGTDHWAAPNTSATNSSGFTGLPGGFLSAYNLMFGGLTLQGPFWTSDPGPLPDAAQQVFLGHDSPDLTFGAGKKSSGIPVRCIKN